jgi:hypothetical protein
MTSPKIAFQSPEQLNQRVYNLLQLLPFFNVQLNMKTHLIPSSPPLSVLICQNYSSLDIFHPLLRLFGLFGNGITRTRATARYPPA